MFLKSKVQQVLTIIGVYICQVYIFLESILVVWTTPCMRTVLSVVKDTCQFLEMICLF